VKSARDRCTRSPAICRVRFRSIKSSKLAASRSRECFAQTVVILLPDQNGQIAMPIPGASLISADKPLDIEIGIAQWAFDRGQPAGFSPDTLPGSEILYISAARSTRARGVLAVKANNRRLLRIPEQRQLLDTFAALIAIALERVHYCRRSAGCAHHHGIGAFAKFAACGALHDLRTPLDGVGRPGRVLMFDET